MDQGDLEQRLQVPTGSKRPSPSPSEGEEDRSIKKFRTQPYDGPPAASTTGGTDHGTIFGGELETTALDIKTEAEADIGWRDLLQNPHQGSESHFDRHVHDAARYADQYGDSITGNYGGRTRMDNIAVSESKTLVASHYSPSRTSEWKSVESTPIPRNQMGKPPSQSLAAFLPKEAVDVRKNCDTCFGVVGHCFLPLGDFSDSLKGNSNSHVIVHAGRWDSLYSCRPQTIWALFYTSGSAFR